MAEVLGAVASGITVAGLLKLCLEAFEIIQVARKQTFEFDKLCLRLNIERARLYTWGQTMDLINDDSEKTSNRLNGSQFENLVIDVLEMILSLFENSDRLKKRYGCSSYMKQVDKGNHTNFMTWSTTQVIPVAAFVESFNNFGVQNNQPGRVVRLAQKARWIIEDRTKFQDLIQEIRSLIDGLQEITRSISTVARQEGVLRYGVQQIRDPDSLNLLTEVCQEDYPDISDAASIKLEVMTLSTHKLENIEVWMNSTSDQPEDLEHDLESMSIAELQRLVRTLTAKESDGSTLANDTLYDDVLLQRDRKIVEQETLIEEMTAAAARQDQLLSALQAQYRYGPEVLEIPPAQTSGIAPLDRLETGADQNRVSGSTLPPPNQSPQEKPNVETVKSLRVAIDDPTYKVLPVALRKYDITDDWRNYGLYIVYGTQEYYCGLHDKPLVLFKELSKHGNKVMFKLRKIPRPVALNLGAASLDTSDDSNDNKG